MTCLFHTKEAKKWVCLPHLLAPFHWLEREASLSPRRERKVTYLHEQKINFFGSFRAKPLKCEGKCVTDASKGPSTPDYLPPLELRTCCDLPPSLCAGLVPRLTAGPPVPTDTKCASPVQQQI